MRRSGIIAKKLGMSSVFTPEGVRIPVTLLEVDCCVVAQRQEKEAGLYALQIGAGKPKRVSKPQKGYFMKCGVAPRQCLREFRVDPEAMMPVGAVLKPDYFEAGQSVDVVGTTIGRGFAGPMKRHNFGGLRASHGVSVSHRSHGSTGQRKDPGKVMKGKKMAGHMGCQRVTVQNLEVISIDQEASLLIVKGAVPGYEGSWVHVSDAIKKPLEAPRLPEFPEDSLEKWSGEEVSSKKVSKSSKSSKSSSKTVSQDVVKKKASKAGQEETLKDVVQEISKEEVALVQAGNEGSEERALSSAEVKNENSGASEKSADTEGVGGSDKAEKGVSAQKTSKEGEKE